MVRTGLNFILYVSYHLMDRRKEGDGRREEWDEVEGSDGMRWSVREGEGECEGGRGGVGGSCTSIILILPLCLTFHMWC